MRFRSSFSIPGLGSIAVLCGLAAGCSQLELFDFREEPSEVHEKNAAAALRGEAGHSKLIGDYINISGLNTVVLEGVGLVTNLDGTGDQPPASQLRTQLLDDMRVRKIENPNQLLDNPNTTMVIVRAYLPPLMRKNDEFDVEVRLPDGSEATSLNGGWLLECDLAEQAVVPGRGVLKGSITAKAKGPILISTGTTEDKTDAVLLRRGSIPGGATYVGDDRNLSIYLRSDYRSVRMSRRIASRIGQRFHDYNEAGIKKPLAEAKTDSRIELIVHSRYRDNYPRFLQCIRHLQLNENEIDRRMRLEQLRDALGRPADCARAALELEAMGVDAVPMLKNGLKSSFLETRFHAAEALAYLGYAEGVPALAEAAAQEPAFRVYAFAALATLDSGEAAMALTELMNHTSAETRYGAFRALSIRPANEVYVNGTDMGGKFKLHVIDSTGPPLVHLTRFQKAEIVVFNGLQEFTRPLVARAGKHILIKGDAGRDTVTISRFAPGEPDQQLEVPARVASVIRAASQLGASYPDIVQMLVQTEKQHNLVGQIGIDALPSAGRVYHRPPDQFAAVGGLPAGPGVEAQIGDEAMAPNLFNTATNPETAGASVPEEPDVAAEALDAASTAAEEDLGPVGFRVK